MFKNLRFPLAYVLELLTAPLLFISFYIVVAFAASEPAASLRASGAVIPAGWEAALPNHGGYLRGFSITSHPALFAMAVAVAVVSGFISWQLRLAQASQRRAAAPEQARRHYLAGMLTFASWAGLGLLLFTQVLPRLAAV